jgi:Rps23 Pro-64 3,4-dihydroxylase Tpa1-like proline 4-hydroxylase
MVEVVKRPVIVPATFAILDEFLAPQELRRILEFVAKQQRRFEPSEVVPDGDGKDLDPEYRRSHVLYELGEHKSIVVRRVKAYLPHILRRLDLRPFRVAGSEAQITASNHGDFFHPHTDNAQKPIRKRVLTFVYYCHNEPKAFRGGELRIYDSRKVNEVTTVECQSRKFADSRFTLNGWLRRA